MSKRFDRTVSLIGEDNLERLHNAAVLVVGLGGVGGSAVEVLARSGIGRLVLVDGDEFESSNLNRQILCAERDIGRSKAVVAGERVKSVNGEIETVTVSEFLTADNAERLVSGMDYCIDAIDDISGKLALIEACKRNNIPIVSAMGAGNRIDCTFTVCDVYKTTCDPFARAVRKALKERGITDLEVVCAVKPPLIKSGTPASVAAPPFVMGAMLANHVISRIIKIVQ